MRFTKSSAAVLAASIPLAVAQTFTDCNPLEKTCPADPGSTSSTYSADLTQGESAASSWSLAEGTTLDYGSNGAEFSIKSAGQAPTVSTDFYIFFGRIDVTMQAAPGTGIVSSIVLESDDLDEIDWEFLGGNTAQVETNFFGKGNTTTYDRAIYYQVANPQSTFHTYTIDWNQDRLMFIIDGVTVRTIAYDDPLTVGGKNYPQTPMRLKLGNWAGGGPGQPDGTVEWAGGQTDFSQAPFTMYVKSVNVQNYNPGSSYVWTDNSGSWQSIKVVDGDSPSGGSNSSSSGSSSATTGSATSTASGTKKSSAATTAPTSMLTVAPLSNGQGQVAPTTRTGSAYSTNTQSISALNNGLSTSMTATSSAPSSSVSSNTNAASSNKVMAAGSLLSGFLALFLL